MIKINNISVQPGYFGKLPEFNDFIKFNAAGNEILILDKWLQDGLIFSKNKLKDNWKKFYEDALPYNFFYPFTGSDNFILGLCFPGVDKSNRNFPFLIFFVLSKNIFNSIPAFYLPLVFNELFNALSKFYYENFHCANLSELNDNLKNIELDVSTVTIENDYWNYLSATSQEKFWQRAFNRIEDQEILNAECETKLINNLLEFKSRADYPLGFKIVFAEEDNSGIFDLSFFLNLIMVPKSKQEYAFFWSYKNNKILLFIFKGTLLPVNFLDLIYSENINDKIMTSISIPDRKTVKFPFLENKKNNLDQLLQYFTAQNIV